MGFKDKWAAAFGMAPADYATDIGGQLPDGDRLIAHSQVYPSAMKGGGSTGSSLTQRLQAKAINAVMDAASKQRHLGGEPGTIAHTLPREGVMHVLAFTTAGLSLWDFGMVGSEGPGTFVQFIARDKVAGVEDTGQRAQGGVPVARVAFVDGSFFDYRLFSKPGQEFWDALRAW